MKVQDPRKANEVSSKADEVQQIAGECLDLYSELSAIPGTEVSPASEFIARYFQANQNILVKDVIVALQANGYVTDWIAVNPDQILDSKTFVLLIICSEKQGNRNAKTL